MSVEEEQTTTITTVMGIVACPDMSIKEKCIEVEKVWSDGEEVDIADEYGETALTTAITQYEKGQPLDLILLLLELGANVNAETNQGETPLIKSIKRSMKENVMEVLLNYGAQVHKVDKDGMSFLDYLDEVGCYASFDYIRCIRYWSRCRLLKCIWEGKKETLQSFEMDLRTTVKENTLYTVLMMLNENVSNFSGWTLLHAAVFIGRTEYVRIILMYLKMIGTLDWCFKRTNNKLQTALTIACAKGFIDIVLLFRDIVFTSS